MILCMSSQSGDGGADASRTNKSGDNGLSEAVRKKLGSLADRANEKVRDVIRNRGGTAANVNATGPWADATLAETVRAAMNGDTTAETAIKIVKQASRLGQKY